MPTPMDDFPPANGILMTTQGPAPDQVLDPALDPVLSPGVPVNGPAQLEYGGM